MEYLIKCYLEQFESSPRNTLHDRKNRRTMVIYINTLIEACVRGMNYTLETAVKEAVSELIKYHEKYKANNSSVCLMGRFHNILYVALKLCYDWQLQSTETVVALLKNIYICEETFERLFVGAIFGNSAPYYIAGWKSDFDSQEENLRAVVYYLEHASKGRLELRKSDTSALRFVDVPMDNCGTDSPTPLKIALQLGLPDKLHILLRFGAKIDDHMIQYLLQRLMEFCHVYPYNLVSCLQLILRAIVVIKCERNTVLENYKDLIDDAILPVTRCGLAVPELKHLSRCVIRERLYHNFQLPRGISNLPLPDSIKKYIDIMKD